MVVPEIVYSTVNNRCPRCHKGKVFENNFAYSFRNGLKMNTNCNKCGLKYERETGFFYGAMYVSYALMSGVFIIWFFTDLFWLHMEAIKLALWVTFSIFILFPLVFRWARIIWINFFVRYDKSYIGKQERLSDRHKEATDTAQRSA